MDLSLYLVADELHFRQGALEDCIVRAVQGGVRVVQLREKNCSNEEFENLARRVLLALKDFSVPVIINDRIDIAQKVNAHGVHLGQNDFSVEEARKLLGPKTIIGLSINHPDQIQVASQFPVDYLGVGSIFPTSSKKDVQRIWGVDLLQQHRGQTILPIVGIGGIDVNNSARVIAAGADGVAVISAFQTNEDWQKKAQLLQEKIREGKQQRWKRKWALLPFEWVNLRHESAESLVMTG